MSSIFWILCFILFLLSIACRALHEYERHELENLCTRKNCKEYFNLIIDHYVNVRLGFEMIRSCLLFAAPILAYCSVVGFGTGAEETEAKLKFTEILVNLLPFFFTYLASRYWVARPLGDLYATAIVYYFFHFFRFVAFFGLPLSFLARFIEVVIQRLAGVPESQQDEEENLEEDIRSIMAEGHRDGIIKDEVRLMVNRIMQLDDAHVSTIMTPRTEMHCISKDATWQEMLDFVNETQLSRIPVFGEDRDDIVGVLFSKDLLLSMSPQSPRAKENWAEYLHEPVYVPETKQINILLEEFLGTQSHFAIVLDEFGGVSGIVTLEDILEQIVGEIADETDDVPLEEIVHADDGSVEVLGRVHIDDLNSHLGINLSTEGDFETIGGFILTKLGCVPKVGEEIQEEELKIVIQEATSRKIEKVRIYLSTNESESESVENGKND